MSSNRMLIIYGVLSLLLIGSAVVLAQQVRHFMYDREDLTDQYRKDVLDPDKVKEGIKKKEADNQRDVLLTFSQTMAFRELATPVPMPTPTPIPPPSPTPSVAARGWMIDFATKKYVFLIDPSKQPVTAQIGQVIKNQYGKDFSIIEINPDIEFPRVKVKEVDTGVVNEITQQAPKNVGNPVPNPPVNKQ